MRIWADSHSPKGTRFIRQVKITVLEWSTQSSDLPWRPSSPNLPQLCYHDPFWIHISIVFSKRGAHKPPQLVGKGEKNNFMCITSVYFSRVSFIFVDSAGLYRKHSCETTDCWWLCDYIPLIQLPLGLKWEQNWVLTKHDRLEKFIPILEISNPRESLDGRFSTGCGGLEIKTGMGHFAGSRGTNVSARGITELKNIFFMVDFGDKQGKSPRNPRAQTDSVTAARWDWILLL